jgi:hypothetical protein
MYSGPTLPRAFLLSLLVTTPTFGEVMDISLTPTPWGSQIIRTEATTPMDTALPGTWRLIRISDGTRRDVPVVDATLTVGSDGRFAMDYSTARLPGGPMAEGVTLELDGVTHEIAPPADMAVPGGCSGEATFTGLVPGVLWIAHDEDPDTQALREAETITGNGEVNLDALENIGTIPGVTTRLVLSTDREAAQTPTMTCEGAGIATKVTAGPPFGFIPGAYPYALNESHDILIIQMPGPAGSMTTFVFVPD